MTGLEPGSRFSKTRFTKEQAEKTLDDLIKQLRPSARVAQRPVGGRTQWHVIPKDMRDRLMLKEDDFRQSF
jgi:hypothetical protein